MIAIHLFVSVLLALMFSMDAHQPRQQPTSAPTITPSPVRVPTSPASATSAALFTTSTALAATTQALLSHSGNGPASQTPGPASQTPRQLPNSGGDDLPWGALAGCVVLLLMAGAWARRSSESEHHQRARTRR